MKLIWLLLLMLLLFDASSSTHISGTFNTNDFFKFLIKFGFQKTEQHKQKDSYGYIFGNITSRTNFSQSITLAVLDRGHFLEYYGNREIRNKKVACAMMFKTLNQSSYDVKCNDNGQDYLRYCFKLYRSSFKLS
jgi:hypothetical protein